MTARERKQLAEVLALVSPWQTHCDYRAEEYLQDACKILVKMLAPKPANPVRE